MVEVGVGDGAGDFFGEEDGGAGDGDNAVGASASAVSS